MIPLKALAWMGILTLLLSACGQSLAKTPIQSELQVTIGDEYLVADLAPIAGQPVVSQDAAVSGAREHVDSWRQAKAVATRYVTLTLRSSAGTPTPGFDKRPVWLVTFDGAVYDPPISCACAVQFRKPSTAVAIDAQNASFVTAFGFDS